MIANHGQEKKYFHKITGCNSRLDSIQASILNIKLKYLDEYSKSRNQMAEIYDESLSKIPDIIIPKRQYNSTHVFHQYTLKIKNNLRDNLINSLKENKIPSIVYYPIPLYKQEAFKSYVEKDFIINDVEKICKSVLSLPIHTEIKNSSQKYIIEKIKEFFKKIS
tara:strand:- start:635 stop:1126 length:492 start_codon:yes stop_codon:yes gene_type:complete